MNVDESDVVRLILGYLRDHRYAGTLRCLEKESGVSECALPGDAAFLRSLVMDGRWDDAIQFAKPLETLKLFDAKAFRFEIEKQRLLEMLDMKAECEAIKKEFDVENVLNVLNCIEKTCPSREEYAALCFLLSLPKLSAHSEYRKWDCMNARMELFDKVYSLVVNFLPDDKGGLLLNPSRGRLLNLICKGVVYERCECIMNQTHDGQELAENGLSSGDVLVAKTCIRHIDMSLADWVSHMSSQQLKETKSERIETIEEIRLHSRISPSKDLITKSLSALEQRPGSAHSWHSRHRLDTDVSHVFDDMERGNEMWRTRTEIMGANGDTRPSTLRQQRSLFHRPVTADGIRSRFTHSVITDHRVNGWHETECLTQTPPATPPPMDTSTPKNPRESIPLAAKLLSSPVLPPHEETAEERHIETDRNDENDPTFSTGYQWPGTVRFSSQQNRKKNDSTDILRRSRGTRWWEKSSDSSVSMPLFNPVASVDDVQAIRSIAFSPRGDFFAVGSNSRTLRICSSRVLQLGRDISQSPLVLFKRNRYHRGSIYCMAWSPLDDVIATGSNDKAVKLMKFNCSHCTQSDAETTLTIHDGTVRDIAFISSTSLSLLSGGAGNCAIHITDCSQTAQTIGHLIGHTDHVTSLYPWGEHMVASGSVDQYVRLWDLRAKQCFLVLGNGSDNHCPSSAVLSVCVSDDNRLLAAALENGQILLYNIQAGRTMATIPVHASECRNVRFAPHTYDVLSASYDSTLSLTNASPLLSDSRTNLVPYCVAQHSDKVIQCRWHPNGIGFASTSADHTVKLWKRASNVT
ncbi:WD repeat-containing protein 47-like [Corticium candelabrum]|uniref:WD repeat-containing protein 47-like n=1 Tax=Corticium candelabrum TaxID=121492 RepID=UPI002E2551F9|nr:WD repeat-containing protein 47-like [Corticium candelabrum]